MRAGCVEVHAIGVAGEICSVAGMLLARNAFDRLHFLGAASIVGPLPIGIAVVVREKTTSGQLVAACAALAVVVLGPVLVHAIAHAARAQ